VVSTPLGWDDTSWQTSDRSTLKAINGLIDARRDLFTGIGKPEQLRHARSGTRSRRTPRNTASSTSSTATTCWACELASTTSRRP
jgi:Txe/YoeB family toxin of Txe-Axe toxin-antitoxin module